MTITDKILGWNFIDLFTYRFKDKQKYVSIFSVTDTVYILWVYHRPPYACYVSHCDDCYRIGTGEMTEKDLSLIVLVVIFSASLTCRLISRICFLPLEGG